MQEKFQKTKAGDYKQIRLSFFQALYSVCLIKSYGWD